MRNHRGTRSKTFGILASYWRIAFLRTWGSNSVIALIVVIIVIAFSRAVTSPALWSSPLRATAALALGLSSVMLVGRGTYRGSLFRSSRFELAPLDGDALLAARIALGNPVRTVVAVAVLLWGVRVILACDRGIPEFAVDACFLLALIAITLVVDDWLTRIRGSAARVLLSGWVFVSYIALLVWARWLFAQSVSVGRDSGSFAAGALFTSSETATHFVWTLIIVATFAIVMSAARRGSRTAHARLSGQKSRQSRPDEPSFARADTGEQVTAEPRMRWASRELAVLARFRYGQVALLIALGASLLAFLNDAPLVLTLVNVGWIGAAYEMLGVDIPHRGVIRYRITGTSERRVIVRRHIAMTAATLSVVIITYALLYMVGDVARTVPTPRSLGSHIVSLFYGTSVYYLLTLTGDYISLRNPRAIHRPSKRPFAPAYLGSANLAFAVILSWILTAVGAALGVAVAARVVGSLASNADVLLIVACAINIGAYTATTLLARARVKAGG